MPANPIFPYQPPLTFVPSIPVASQSPSQTASVNEITAGISQVVFNPTPAVTNYEPSAVSTIPTNASQDIQRAESIQTNVNAPSMEQLFASVPASNSSPSLIESFTTLPTPYAQYSGPVGVQQHVSGN